MTNRPSGPSRLLRIFFAFALAAAAAGACSEVTGPEAEDAQIEAGPGTDFAARDVAPPTVKSVIPANGATGVGTTTRVVIQFSERMNESTINSSTFTLAPQGGSPVAGVIGFQGGNKVSFDVSSAMVSGTAYVVRLTTAVKDVSGNSLASEFTSSFTTAGTPPDVTAPTVTSVSPLNGATSVLVASNVLVTFSEAMNASTINASSVTLTPTAGGSPVATVVTYDAGSRTATVNPSSSLATSTGYTVNVTAVAKDVAGNSVTPFSSSFTTEAPFVDATAPTVTNVAPANSATGINVGSDVVLTFSEPMNAATITTSTFTLAPTSGGSPVSAVVSYNSTNGTATLNPSANLAASTSYTVNATGAATDVAGNGLVPFASSFTTAAAADVTPPTVTSVAPAGNATGVSVASDIVVTFSEAMNAATVTGSTFTLTPTSGGSPVAAAVSYNAGSATLNPSSSLAFSTGYTVNVTSAATDAAGNALVPFASSFTTAAAPDVTSPTVTNVTPLNAATGVAVGADVIVTFSEAMNAASVTGSTFTLTPTSGGSPVAAAVSYNAGTATLNPSSSLTFNTSYTVNVTSGATDVSGNALTPFSSSFTTAAAPDVTAPTVTNVSPTTGATGVGVGADVVVTFSEPMNGASVTTSTFTLTPTAGGSPVAAVVSYNSGTGTATLNPSANLVANTSYTVNVTSGATDVAGNPLTAFASSFTTAAPAGDVTPPTVAMLGPVNGATGISTTAKVVVQFSEVMNLSTINSSTFTLSPQGGSAVPGVIEFHGSNIVSIDVVSPMLTGTTYVVRVSSGAKDVAGNGVSPEFTSSFTTAGTPPDATAPTVTNVSPVNGATGVAVESNVTVTFSEAMNATTITGSTFTLTPAAGGSPVAAVVSYNAGVATLNPSGSLAASTGYTVNVTTGARDLAGNPLVAFASSFTTGAAADVTSPTVTNVTPVNAATSVSVGADVVVTFSEAMNAATVTGSTFTLTPTSGGSPVAAAVSYNAGTATLNPSSSLAFSTSYTVNVTSAATDAAGNALVPFTSSFTTAAAPDVTSPTVTIASPYDGESGIAVGSNITVTFSEPMNATTITSSTFTVTPTAGGSPVAAVVSYSGNLATLNPSAALLYSTAYTLNVTTGAKDLAGNALVAFASSFTTGAAPDVTSPTVTTVTPVNAATSVAVGADVVVTFSEAMNAATVTGSTFTLTPTSGGSPVAAAVSYNAGTATLNPSASLAFSTSYTVNVTSAATDAAGNPLVPFASSFTTAAAPDLTSPTVTNVTPANSATGVGVGVDVVVTFSEAMNAATVTGSTFTVTPTSGGSPVAAAVSYNAGTATLNPSSSLAFNTSYTVNVTSGATDVAGNALVSFSSSFTTAQAPDLTAPTVISVSPVNSASGVAVGADVVVTFSEAMNAATITTSTFTLTPTSGGSPVGAAVSYSSGPRTATLNPSANLAAGISYTVSVTSGATDVAGNGLTAFSSTFTTAADLTAPAIVSITPSNRSVNIADNAQVRVTFNEPINPATVTDSTFKVVEVLPGWPAHPGTRTYDAATNTIIFTPTAGYKNHVGYNVKINPGLRDVAGNPVSTGTTTCFSPTAGVGAAMSMNGVWAGNNACEEVHWHVVIAQTGDQLSLGNCTSEPININCLSSAVTEAGRVILGGSSCTPSTLGAPRICDVRVVSLTGTVSGASVTFTMTMENGLTFTFNGSRSQTGNGNPFFTGVMSGPTLQAVGMNLQREGL